METGTAVETVVVNGEPGVERTDVAPADEVTDRLLDLDAEFAALLSSPADTPATTIPE
jgi:hypothetical protein